MKTVKTIKTIFLICLVLLTFSCNKSDDDSSDFIQLTTAELLTSGKWYQESNGSGSNTACERKGYVQFMSNGDFVLNNFDENSGNCESLGITTATYTLSNNKDIVITLGIEIVTATIQSISESELTLETPEETLVFDKIEG